MILKENRWERILAYLFMLPIIEKEPGCLKWLNNKFRGFYCYDTNKPDWGDKIVLCYELYAFPHELQKKFNENEYAYQQYTEIIDSVSYKILAFTVPPSLKKDFDCIMKGNLDGLRPQYRSMLRNFWKGSGPLNKLINDLLSALWRNYSRGFAFKNKILNLNEVPIKKECA